MAFESHGNIMEHITEGIDIVSIASGTSATSMALDMTDYDKCCFTVGMSCCTHDGFGIVPIDIMQSSDSTGTQTSVIGLPATAKFGSSNTSHLSNVKAFKITLATEATNSTDALIINGTTFSLTTSTIYLTASAASARYFGSTIGASAAGGLEAITSALATMLNNTTWGLGLVATAATISTAAVRVEVVDTASTHFTVQTTGGASAIIATVERAEAYIEVHADDMTAGQKCLTCKVGTVATSVTLAVAYSRQGRRAGGVADHHHGSFYKSSVTT